MMNDAPETVTLVPIERIEILNSRDRNMKIFEEIVENIRAIGLKKPITVTERSGADGEPLYALGPVRASYFHAWFASAPAAVAALLSPIAP